MNSKETPERKEVTIIRDKDGKEIGISIPDGSLDYVDTNTNGSDINKNASPKEKNGDKNDNQTK